MLKITIRTTGEVSTLELEGKLAGPWVEELANCCARERSRHARLAIELRNISYIDAAGKHLLHKLHREGAALAGSGCHTRAIIAEVSGERAPLEDCGHSLLNQQRKIIAVLVAFLFLGSAARAQQRPLRLTLRDAVILALEQNPQTIISAFEAKQAAAQQAIELAGLLPQVEASTSETRVRQNLETFFGHALPGLPTAIGPFGFFTVGVPFTVPLVDLSTLRRWQAARFDAAAARESLQLTREEIALEVTSTYLRILRAAANVRAAQSRVELAQAIYDQAADMQKQGAGTAIDTMRSNVELQNERQRLLEVQTDREVAVFELERLLGIDPTQTIELSDEMKFYETPATDVQASLEQAWNSRPELRALESTLRAAEDRKRAAWDQHLPTVDATGFWEEQGLAPASVIPVYQYQAELKVPVFSGGRTHAEVRQAEYQIAKLKQQRLDLRNQIAVEVRSAAARLASARQQVEVANQGLDLSRQELQQARDRFASGVANNVEVVQAQDELSRASDNQISALYQYNASRANLARAMGQMEALYTK